MGEPRTTDPMVIFRECERVLAGMPKAQVTLGHFRHGMVLLEQERAGRGPLAPEIREALDLILALCPGCSDAKKTVRSFLAVSQEAP